MDKVLVVDTDPDILKQAEEGIRELHHFELLTASSLESAIAVLREKRISALVTDIRLAGTDGIELLAFMTRKLPSVPCIALLGEHDPKPWFPERRGHVGVLHYISKPFTCGDLANAIFVGLNLRDEGMTRNGMILRNFLPLPVLLRKTCRLEIRCRTEKSGCLYFADGRLLDATCGKNSGEATLKEMAGWRGFQMTVSNLPAERKSQRITGDMMAMINATWKETEARPKPAPAGAAPSVNPAREPIAQKTAATRQTAPENEPPAPQQAPPKANRLTSALDRNAGILRTIKGYKGMAVINGDGKVLAADRPEGAIDFDAIAETVNRIHTDSSRHLSQKKMGPCSGLSLHTPHGLLILRTTDVYAGGNFRFIAAISEEGNGHFLQVQLKTIIPKILSELSQPAQSPAGAPAAMREA